ncbi:MAG: tRNA pseudouridine(55) synthase TruB, partial [Shewanella sp.]
MARRPKGRFIDGIVLLDKPTGMSSNHALQRVKRMYGAAKAGHTGALDPLATGMLPVCLGEATKFSSHLLDADKRYLVTAKLGVRTDTSDSDGEVVQERPLNFTDEQLQQALEYFRGETMQVPSMFSALKYQGQPLYKYAREGKEVPREARPITVYELNFVSLEGDELTLDIHCSKGTYIRTITDDLGEMLGCGAHVIMLRRTKVADYPYEKMVTLEQLQALVDNAAEQELEAASLLDPLLLPMDTAVANFPVVHVPAESVEFLMNGN